MSMLLNASISAKMLCRAESQLQLFWETWKQEALEQSRTQTLGSRALSGGLSHFFVLEAQIHLVLIKI